MISGEKQGGGDVRGRHWWPWLAWITHTCVPDCSFPLRREGMKEQQELPSLGGCRAQPQPHLLPCQRVLGMPVAINSAVKSKFSSFIGLACNWIQHANSTEPVSTDFQPFQAPCSSGSPLGSRKPPLGAGAALGGASQPIQALCLQRVRDASAFEQKREEAGAEVP